jgi:perosamine synthetase
VRVDVPFFRPEVLDDDVNAVSDVLRSGWLTTGPVTRRFERQFAAATRAAHAVAVNSCTAALHLALEALGLRRGDGVLVPTMTFAATAEVVRYFDAVPLLVDCDPVTGHIALDHAAEVVERAQAGKGPGAIAGVGRIAGVIPVHVGGLMLDVAEVRAFAARHQLWVVEDAAHAFPAAWRTAEDMPWQWCGGGTADVTCFSFYANKTITSGEGGMATTESPELAARMRLMSLHGLSHEAWDRYTPQGHWDYRIMAAGFKYNLPDIAAALGLSQLGRAEDMRRRRERIAATYRAALDDDDVELPPDPANRVHAWHLFPIRLRIDRLGPCRDAVIADLRAAGILCSVHWRPLHLHPYYQATYGYRPSDCPSASALFERVISLPLFPSMSAEEVDAVVRAVRTAIGLRPGRARAGSAKAGSA